MASCARARSRSEDTGCSAGTGVLACESASFMLGTTPQTHQPHSLNAHPCRGPWHACHLTKLFLKSTAPWHPPLRAIISPCAAVERRRTCSSPFPLLCRCAREDGVLRANTYCCRRTGCIGTTTVCFLVATSSLGPRLPPTTFGRHPTHAPYTVRCTLKGWD